MVVVVGGRGLVMVMVVVVMVVMEVAAEIFMVMLVGSGDLG